MEIKLITALAIQVSHLPKFILRTILLLYCTAIFGFSPDSLISQNPKIIIDQNKEVTIYQVLEIIGKQTKCTFIYQSEIFKDLPKIELKKGTIKVNDLLKKFLSSEHFEIKTTKNNYISITRRISNVSQDTIKGVVTDSLGMGMAGVNIIIKNTSKGTQSDLDGKYSIVAHPSDTLVFTYVGYKPQEIAVGIRTVINVVMQADATALDAVVINAGYYKVTDRERTGSIARITAKDIENQPVKNPLAALQGRIPGVNIVETSGAPGGGFNVRIRGQNSIMGGNEPLYIIDGVPYDSRSLSNISISTEIFPDGNISPLNAINPATIESIEVLKDADATAIYGSRGANGVVLITTKKGKEGRTRLTINSNTGIAHITKKANLLNTQQYLNMRLEAFANDGISDIPANAYDLNGTWNTDRYTDWQEVLIGNTAQTQSLQASFSGGSAETQYLLSGMYQKETTVFPGTFEYDRININSSINHTDKDERFKLLFNVSYALQDNKLPKKDLTLDALYLPPNAPALYDINGNLNWENSTWTNPMAALQAIYTNKTNSLLANSVLSYALLKNLTARINMGYGNTALAESYINPHTIYDPAFGLDSSASQLFENNANNQYYILEPQIEWMKSYSWGNLSLLAGATYQKNQNTEAAFVGIGFPNNRFINNLSSAAILIALNEQEQVYSYSSFFGRINYGHKDKLFLNLTGRRDGSSRFAPGNKYGNFGAAGAAYIFSEDLNIPWLSFGKIRGSYGITGNDQIGDYQYLQSYTIIDNPYDANIGLAPARLYNPNFKWEENKKLEAALELGFWGNKHNLEVGYYRNRSSNQLINYSLPGTTGFSSILTNLDAVVENTGIEITNSNSWIRINDFSWNTSWNLTIPKNRLVRFPNLENSTYANRFVIGEPLTITKLYKLNGVNPDTGVFEFEDFNGDGEITSARDREYVADLSPKFYGGLSNSLSYKNWGLNFLFQFVKREGFNQYSTSSVPGTMVNQPVEVLDRWEVSGDSAFMQQFTSGANQDAFLAYSRFAQSSGIVSDASFIRLKTMQLSYSIPIEKGFPRSCRISLNGQNLLTFTNFKGADPEQTPGYIPSLRRITMAFQLEL